MRIGIIGYGGFGRFLYDAWRDLPEVSVVAVADATADLPAGAGVMGYRDADALLADEGVELVSICTPPATHARLACRALEGGKHVLVEKPLATTLAEADEIIAAQRRTGRAVGINYVMRYTPIAEQLLAWSRDETFGPLRRVTVENEAQDEALPAGHWFWDPALSGGILVEHAVHFIDLIDACAGRGAVAVSGAALRREDGRADRVSLQAQYGEKLLASQYHAFTRPKAFERTEWNFRFEALEVALEGWIPLAGRVRGLVGPQERDALAALPGFTRTRLETLGSVPHIAGRRYEATHLIEGHFESAEPKDAVYRRAVQQALLDVIAAARSPQHALRVTLEDARRSLDIALLAGSE